MSFKSADYVVAAIPNSPAFVIAFSNNMTVSIFNNAQPPGHLRFRRVLMVHEPTQLLVVLDHLGTGPSLAILPFSQACAIPSHLHQTAQQAINTQLGQLATFQAILAFVREIKGILDQIKRAKGGVLTPKMWLIAVKALSRSTIAATGIVVSGGAAIMSKLALLGTAVGGGAAAGIGIAAAVPGMAVTELVNSIEDDEEIKNINRITGVTATAAGATASVACVSAAGITGLSASGITTGLVGVGSTIGMSTMVGGIIACGAMTGGIAAISVVPGWLWARNKKRNRIQTKYNQFVASHNGLGYVGPP